MRMAISRSGHELPKVDSWVTGRNNDYGNWDKTKPESQILAFVITNLPVGEPSKASEIAIGDAGGLKNIMTPRKAFYHRAETCRKSVAFTKGEGVWSYERRLAAEVERLARKGNRVQPGIGAAVGTQERTLERVTRCAA